jgi:hypothetical protein
MSRPPAICSACIATLTVVTDCIAVARSEVEVELLLAGSLTLVALALLKYWTKKSAGFTPLTSFTSLVLHVRR